MSNAVTGIQEERCNFDTRQRNDKGNYYDLPKKAKHTQTLTNEPKNHKIKLLKKKKMSEGQNYVPDEQMKP